MGNPRSGNLALCVYVFVLFLFISSCLAFFARHFKLCALLDVLNAKAELKVYPYIEHSVFGLSQSRITTESFKTTAFSTAPAQIMTAWALFTTEG